MKRLLAILILFVAIILSPIGNSIEIPWVPKTEDIMYNIGRFSKSALNPNSIKILVWNIYKGSRPSWSQDFNKLSRNQDIIMIQEMYLNPVMNDLFEDHQGYGYHTATSFIYLPSLTRTGVANASRVKPVRSKFQRSRVREPLSNTPKMALESFYKIKGTNQELMVVNIHAINFVSSNKLAIQLKDIAKDIKKFDGPVVFAGDFNTWSNDKLYIMREIIIQELNMKEVHFKEDHRKAIFGNIIDYIFIKDLDVINSKSFGDTKGSDHTPMQVELMFN